MTDYLLLFVGTVLVNNFVLVKFLGLCPFMGVSKKLETAMGMGLATTFVMTLASICAWLIDTWILIPLGLIYLRTLAFILVIAVVVQFTEMVVRKTSPALYRLLGIFLPLITTNCAVLGVALLNINLGHNFHAIGAVRFFRRRRFLAGYGAVCLYSRASGGSGYPCAVSR
jgi:electron transport complex protein RnfA